MVWLRSLEIVLITCELACGNSPVRVEILVLQTVLRDKLQKMSGLALD